MEDEIRNYLSYLKDLGEEELFVERKASSREARHIDGRRVIEELRQEAEGCRRCSLHETRTKLVFGVGNTSADLMFIGEAPGRDEDIKGEPFVGAAGKLLDRILKAMELCREEVYIANLLKCRPPNNRDPMNDEIEACWSILERQIDLVAPVVICTLGSFATRTLLGSHAPLGRLRERVHTFKGIDVVPTYHPAALLRHPAWKRPTWEDMKVIMQLLSSSG